MISKDLIIKIKIIPRSNDVRQTTQGYDMEFYTSNHIIGPFVDIHSRKYVTGLNESDIEYIKSTGFAYDLDDNYIGVPHPFWESPLAKITLTYDPVVLMPGRNILEFIQWKYLLVSKFVYCSESDILTGLKPEATHYIYNEEEENAVKASKLQRRDDLIIKLSKLSLTRKRQFVMLIENENTDYRNEDYLRVKLNEIINNPQKINELEELLNIKNSDVTLLSDIKRCLHKNIFKKTPKGIYYLDRCLGVNETDVLEYLKDVNNQMELIEIREKLNKGIQTQNIK